jgi:hypothetical protein
MATYVCKSNPYCKKGQGQRGGMPPKFHGLQVDPFFTQTDLERLIARARVNPGQDAGTLLENLVAADQQSKSIDEAFAALQDTDMINRLDQWINLYRGGPPQGAKEFIQKAANEIATGRRDQNTLHLQPQAVAPLPGLPVSPEEEEDEPEAEAPEEYDNALIGVDNPAIQMPDPEDPRFHIELESLQAIPATLPNRTELILRGVAALQLRETARGELLPSRSVGQVVGEIERDASPEWKRWLASPSNQIKLMTALEQTWSDLVTKAYQQPQQHQIEQPEIPGWEPEELSPEAMLQFQKFQELEAAKSATESNPFIDFMLADFPVPGEPDYPKEEDPEDVLRELTFEGVDPIFEEEGDLYPWAVEGLPEVPEGRRELREFYPYQLDRPLGRLPRVGETHIPTLEEFGLDLMTNPQEIHPASSQVENPQQMMGIQRPGVLPNLPNLMSISGMPLQINLQEFINQVMGKKETEAAVLENKDPSDKMLATITFTTFNPYPKKRTKQKMISLATISNIRPYLSVPYAKSYRSLPSFIPDAIVSLDGFKIITSFLGIPSNIDAVRIDTIYGNAGGEFFTTN